MNDLWHIVDRDYGRQSCSVIEPVQDKYNNLQDELYKLLALKITENMGYSDSTEI